MNVAIVTLSGYWNYGNRLQNLALKWVLENKYSADVSSMRTWQTDTSFGLPHGIRGYLSVLKHGKIFETLKMRKRVRKFIEFSSDNLHESTVVLPVQGYGKYLNKYDFVVVGSDQVWNPTWLSQEEFRFFLLDEVKPEKRISYAASIGIDYLTDPFVDILSEEISNFRAVSVREIAGTDLVTRLTDGKVRVETVLDPTLLVTKDEWTKILNISENDRSGGVVTYFLGEKSSQTERVIEILTTKFGSVRELHSTEHGQLKHYDASPQEFVQLISDSKVVVTDSFHAAVFANLFNKPVLIAKRPGVDMSSRLVSLYDLLGVDIHKVEDIDNISDFESINWPTDFPSLDYARQTSMEFLTKALDLSV